MLLLPFCSGRLHFGAGHHWWKRFGDGHITLAWQHISRRRGESSPSSMAFWSTEMERNSASDAAGMSDGWLWRSRLSSARSYGRVGCERSCWSCSRPLRIDWGNFFQLPHGRFRRHPDAMRMGGATQRESIATRLPLSRDSIQLQPEATGSATRGKTDVNIAANQQQRGHNISAFGEYTTYRLY